MNTSSPLLDPANPAAWLLGSTALAVVAANLAWLASGRGRRDRSTGWQIASWLAIAWFYLLPPLPAWHAGALSPYYLGLSGLDWVPTLMAGAPVVALVVALLLVGWLSYRRTLPHPTGMPGRGRDQNAAALRAPLDAALRQWHWAFYRAMAIAWAGTWAAAAQPAGILGIDPAADPLYWGSWLGLLFVAVEWVLNPFARADLRRAGAQEGALRQVVLAVATTAIFALTRNLWLCLLCHVAVDTVIVGWLTPPAREHT